MSRLEITGDLELQEYIGVKLTCAHRLWFDIHSHIADENVELQPGLEVYCVKCGNVVQIASVNKQVTAVQIQSNWRTVVVNERNDVLVRAERVDIVKKHRRKHIHSTPEDDRAAGIIGPEEGTQTGGSDT